MVNEAKRLKLSGDDIKQMVERGFKDEYWN
jgi:hypothetical protein